MASAPHIVLFPFMAKGHTIPLLHLARLLVHRSISVTIFTTPANRPFIAASLSDIHVSIINLPFPENIHGLSPGVESTDMLPDISLWVSLAKATKLMKPHFDKSLKLLRPVSFMITDSFLWWTIDSAIESAIPRMVFNGMSNSAMTLIRLSGESGILSKVESDDALFSCPHFPWIKLTRNDFDPPFNQADPKGPHFDFIIDTVNSTNKSYGILVNSFSELEADFLEYWNQNFSVKLVSVGPFCLASPLENAENVKYEKPYWIRWLDQKLEEGKTVLYVAFGSQAHILPDQFQEIKSGLEKSGVNFLWVTRKKGTEIDGFEERVKDRGLIVKEWVDQRKILEHESVQGFLSHCGWNSVIESICAKVPILGWPMMAEQPLNARMVVEEMKIGIMVERCNGSIRGFVKGEDLKKKVKELMEGEKGEEVRKKVEEIGEAAIRAMEEGGSSWNSLNRLVMELHAKDIYT